MGLSFLADPQKWWGFLLVSFQKQINTGVPSKKKTHPNGVVAGQATQLLGGKPHLETP